MKIKKFRTLSNIIIVSMLIFLCGYITSSNYSYVFSYQNEDIVYSGNKNSNKISLMFNVYWGSEFIPQILDILDGYEAKCTFFVGGQWVEKESNLLTEIYNRGHEIGSHGYFHKEHEFLDYNQNYDEIHITHELVKSILDIDMNLFAPPSGSFNKSTLASCKDLGYTMIMWSKDTIDWRDQDPNIIFSRATNNVNSGDLILAHPTDATLRALPLILEYYKINNLCATTVSNTLR